MLLRNPLYIPKFGNRPCVCGSGKKMKKCHGKEYAITKEEYEEARILNDAYNERVKSMIDKIKEMENEE